MANRYDGDDREDVIEEQSETDPSGSTDNRRPEDRREGEQKPGDTPGSANGQ